MKKLIALFLCAALLAALPLGLAAEDELELEGGYDYTLFKGAGITIDVYNWGEYISDGSDDSLDINKAFEQLTGIKVRYTTFASNEEMYAKLKSGAASYDVIIPSDYMVARMINEGMLQKLDYSNIPNYKFIGEAYKGLEYDPDNEYSVPYTWGVVGLIYNTTMIEDEITSWDALWDPRYTGNILMFANSRDAFGISLIRLGYNVNTTDADEIAEAAEELMEQKMLVQAYVMDQIFDKMEGGEAAIAPYYNGDALVMIEENPDLAFAIPEEGTNYFVDSMVIPADAQHKQAAEMYINFMLEAQVALANAEYIGYSTPNTAAYELLDDEIKNDPVAYPGVEALGNTQVFTLLPTDTAKLLDGYWTEILSYNESGSAWFGPVFLGLMFASSIVILAVRAFKHKKKEY